MAEHVGNAWPGRNVVLCRAASWKLRMQLLYAVAVWMRDCRQYLTAEGGKH